MPNIPTLVTPRLIVRELIAADELFYSRYFINYEVVRYLGAQLPWPYPEGGIIEFFKNPICR